MIGTRTNPRSNQFDKVVSELSVLNWWSGYNEEMSSVLTNHLSLSGKKSEVES